LLACLSAASAFTPQYPITQVNIHQQWKHSKSRGMHNVIISRSKVEDFRGSLYSTKTEAAGSSSSKGPSIAPSIFSAAMLLALDICFRRLFKRLAISFPSSLGGCCALFVALLTLPGGDAFFKAFSPGAALLAKWLPVFFVPSLVTLPLAGNVGSATEVCSSSFFLKFRQKSLSSNALCYPAARLGKYLRWL
jgi:putative effector of murein hydrolase LrgA (UPF0299 family)